MYLRPLEESDGEFLCSIFANNEEYYKIFYDPEKNADNWSKRIITFLKNKLWKHYIVMIEGNKPIGWFGYIDEEKTRTLIIIVFKKEFNHLGYGSKVMSDFIDDCKKSNVTTIFVNVNEDNIKAINFYKKFGFEIYDMEIAVCNDKMENKELKMKLTINSM